MDRFESHPVLKMKINKFIPLLTIPVIASQINKSSKQKCSIREILISCKHPLFKGAVSKHMALWEITWEKFSLPCLFAKDDSKLFFSTPKISNRQSEATSSTEKKQQFYLFFLLWPIFSPALGTSSFSWEKKQQHCFFDWNLITSKTVLNFTYHKDVFMKAIIIL